MCITETDGAIFRDDESVFTISISSVEQLSGAQAPENVDLILMTRSRRRISGKRCFRRWRNRWRKFKPDIVFMGRGDPFCEAQLGGLRLTKTGLKEAGQAGV